jgi:hypothetical protein
MAMQRREKQHSAAKAARNGGFGMARLNLCPFKTYSETPPAAAFAMKALIPAPDFGSYQLSTTH